MDPISLGLGASTLATIGTGASAAGGITGAIGSIIGGNASKKMYDYQAGIAKINQRNALQDADYARSVGETEAQTSGMKTRFTRGKIVSGQSASGLDVNSGSNQRVQEGEQAIGTHDQAVIRSSAAKRAYGYETEAATDSAQSEVYKMSGQQSQRAGQIGAATSILGGATSVAGKWLDASKVGLYSGSDGYYGGSPSNNSLLRPV